MGYCYEIGYDGRHRLACDKCGQAGGVRKRTCKYRVTYRDGSSLPYCYPPALCGPCYKALGGLNGVHDERCREGAAESQHREDERTAALDRGESLAR